MKKALLATALLLTSLAPASATEYDFGNFDTTINTSFNTPPLVPLQLELGKFITGFTPTLANTASWQVNWISGPTGFVDSSSPDWEASLTLTNNATFALNAQLYLWAFDSRIATTDRQWALFTDTSWLVFANSAIDPSVYSYDFSGATTAVAGSLNLRTQVATTAFIPAVPEPATWGLIGGFSTLLVAFWRRRRAA